MCCVASVMTFFFFPLTVVANECMVGSSLPRFIIWSMNGWPVTLIDASIRGWELSSIRKKTSIGFLQRWMFGKWRTWPAKDAVVYTKGTAPFVAINGSNVARSLRFYALCVRIEFITLRRYRYTWWKFMVIRWANECLLVFLFSLFLYWISYDLVVVRWTHNHMENNTLEDDGWMLKRWIKRMMKKNTWSRFIWIIFHRFPIPW